MYVWSEAQPRVQWVAALPPWGRNTSPPQWVSCSWVEGRRVAWVQPVVHIGFGAAVPSVGQSSSCYSLFLQRCETEINLWALLACELFDSHGSEAQEWLKLGIVTAEKCSLSAVADAFVVIVPLLILFLSLPLISPCAPSSWLVWWFCLINPLCFAFNSSPCAAEWHK